VKSNPNNSWVWHVNQLLSDYGLPSAFDLLKHQPKKDKWRETVKNKVQQKWEKLLKEEAKALKTLRYLNLQVCSLSEPHPVWRLGPAPGGLTKHERSKCVVSLPRL
jgi:arsenate reductase-like glutaredoxin family protein